MGNYKNFAFDFLKFACADSILTPDLKRILRGFRSPDFVAKFTILPHLLSTNFSGHSRCTRASLSFKLMPTICRITACFARCSYTLSFKSIFYTFLSLISSCHCLTSFWNLQLAPLSNQDSSSLWCRWFLMGVIPEIAVIPKISLTPGIGLVGRNLTAKMTFFYQSVYMGSLRTIIKAIRK